MKKAHKLPLIFIAALFALVLALLFGISAGNGLAASAETVDPYKFSITHYNIEYDLSSNCSVAVTEDITIHYEGPYSTGFLRDIPINDGAQVKNVNVVKYTVTDNFSSATESVYFDVDIEDSSFITVDIGSSTNKYGKSESYKITYTYNITNSVVNSGTVPLNVIGHGWECTIRNANVTIKLPAGYIDADCYIGSVKSEDTYPFEENADKTQLFAHVDSLKEFEGLTFYVHFEDGIISAFFDFTPYIFIIAGAVLLLIIVALKFLCFNKNTLTPVINFEAPNDMTPLVMGKLIDNKVNTEDVTAMIFYFADKGWLKINLEDENDPVLIRIVQQLPASCEDYEKLMFANLFGNEDAVRTSSLTYRFYRTVDKVTAIVNAKTKGLYSGTSLGVSILFALLGALLMGIAPLLIAVTQISAKFIILAPFITLMPALFIYAITETIKYYSLKWKPRTKALFGLIVALICAVLTGAYMLFLPNAIMGYLPKALLCIVSCLCIVCSVLLIGRTKSYNEQLNQIVGFKNFITLAEKDRLEKLLKDDPQIYYHILPYAQVLGVSDKWEEKFENITIAPPEWVTGSTARTLFEFHMINRIIHTSTTRMSNTFHSRPSSSGRNGGGFNFGGGGGHSGGGFSGGGFGGGGGRGR